MRNMQFVTRSAPAIQFPKNATTTWEQFQQKMVKQFGSWAAFEGALKDLQAQHTATNAIRPYVPPCECGDAPGSKNADKRAKANTQGRRLPPGAIRPYVTPTAP